MSRTEDTPPPNPLASRLRGGLLSPPLSIPASPEDDDPILADLIDELTARLQAGRVVDAESLMRQHPDHAEQLRELLPALQALAQAAPNAPPLPDEQATTDEVFAVAALPAQKQLGDFLLVREVGRGGMGVVYEAEQLSLGRRVALKVLPFASALEPRHVQRFKNEAMAVAGLHHAHIVPVYAVGSDQGVHFYAMQLIDGVTLAAVIAEHRREPDAASGLIRPKSPICPLSPIKQAASLMLHAAEAVEYAHQSGIIHRDIKPANLMLDGRGWLWVTDFGLACCQGGVGLTGTSEQPGTLRYMSPEQALGPRGVVDQRTDVYALGVTLYELLTLQAAYPGDSRQELLSQIAAQEPRRPRSLNRAIPADLETIVLKAMAPDAGQRYTTAQDLADDLRRFLEDRPIHARRPSLAERGKRWLRRHRAVAWAATAVVVVAFAALGISTVVVLQQRDEARASQKQTQLVVNRMYTDFAEKWLAQQPHLEPLQLEYLQLALGFFEDQMRQRGRDPEVRLSAAQAARRVGDIRQKLGEYDRAEEAYTRAEQLLEALSADHPTWADVRTERAVAANHHGNLLRRRGQLVEAREAYRQARDIFGLLADQAPDEPAYRDGLAGSLSNFGAVEHNLGRTREAEDAYRKAVLVLRRLAGDEPHVLAYRHDLASCCNNLGGLLQDLDRLIEAERAYQAALALWAKLAVECPDVIVYRQAAAACLNNEAGLFDALGRPQKAEQTYRDSIKRRSALAENFPRVSAYRVELSVSKHALGLLLVSLGRLSEAEQLLREAFVARNDLAKKFPDVPDLKRDLAASHDGFGQLLAATGRWRQAEEAYREALKLRARLATNELQARQGGEESSSGSTLLYRRELAVAQRHLGLVLMETGSAGEAEKLYRQALAAFEEASAFVALPSLSVQRAALLSDLGSLLHATGRTEEAEKMYRQAVAMLDAASIGPASRAGRKAPLGSRHLPVLAQALDRLGALLYAGRDTQSAANCFLTARTYRERLANDYPAVPAFHGGLAWFLATCPDERFRDSARAVELARKARDLAPGDGDRWRRLGVACYRAGEWKQAAAALDKAVNLYNGGTRTDWLFLAMSHWQLGDQQAAQRWYNRALERSAKDLPASEALKRFQAEAAALIPHPVLSHDAESSERNDPSRRSSW